MAGESAYSYSLTTFSPSGKLVQIQYALSAVSKSPTSLGIKGEACRPALLFSSNRVCKKLGRSLPSPPPFKSAASPTPAGRRAVRRFRLPRHRQAGACRTLRPGGPRRARTHAVLRCAARRAARPAGF